MIKMIYVTGDCHGDFTKFSKRFFTQQKNMTKDDIVIILGDFGGIQNHPDEHPIEKLKLDWLNDLNFTTAFIDGNHDNFDRLLKDYETCDFYGGKAHKIRDSIYHLIRGEIYTIEKHTFFAFGGAKSHDIQDGILDPSNYKDEIAVKRAIQRWKRIKTYFRVKGRSWWEQELPSTEEMEHGKAMLEKYNNKVDFVLTHCAPQHICEKISNDFEPDIETEYFDEISKKLDFKKWFCGHYHIDSEIDNKHQILFHEIIRIL